MASMAMAQAVLEHAHQFDDVDNWYVVAECWDALAVLEELDQQEERSQVRSGWTQRRSRISRGCWWTRRMH